MCTMTPRQYNEMRAEFEGVSALIDELKEQRKNYWKNKIAEACRNDTSHVQEMSKN